MNARLPENFFLGYTISRLTDDDLDKALEGIEGVTVDDISDVKSLPDGTLAPRHRLQTLSRLVGVFRIEANQALISVASTSPIRVRPRSSSRKQLSQIEWSSQCVAASVVFLAVGSSGW